MSEKVAQLVANYVRFLIEKIKAIPFFVHWQIFTTHASDEQNSRERKKIFMQNQIGGKMQLIKM